MSNKKLNILYFLYKGDKSYIDDYTMFDAKNGCLFNYIIIIRFPYYKKNEN